MNDLDEKSNLFNEIKRTIQDGNENLIIAINDASKAFHDLKDQPNGVEYLVLLENASNAYSRVIESSDDAGVHISILDNIKNEISKINNIISFISLLQNGDMENDEIYIKKIKELENIINNDDLESIDSFLDDEFNDFKYFGLSGGDLFVYYILTERKMLAGVPNLPVGSNFKEILQFEDERISRLNIEKKVTSDGDSYDNVANIIEKNRENILKNVRIIDYINFFRELNDIRLKKNGTVYNYVRLNLLLNEVEQEFAT